MKIEDIVKKHQGRYGQVYLVKRQGEILYSVYVEVFSGPNRGVKHVRSCLGIDIASEFFDSCVKFIQNKQPWSEPRRKCAYNPKKTKLCTASNCPAELGGSAHWEIFCKTCMCRTR
ncbi:MAG: hypothetical protein R8N50_00090 [Alphaproteobacteria bacterium]|nr:hypothetical protein [Alphaproteobacteria bacterium]